MKNYLIILFAFSTSLSFAQLALDTNTAYPEMVKEYLIGPTSGIIVNAVQYQGHRKSIAGFTDPSNYAIISKGVAISTGNVFDAIGPNDSGSKGEGSSGLSDKDLELLANGKSYDAAILIIDFIPTSDSFSFDYFFASEEYPEYVNKGVNDVFAFIVKRVGDSVGQNLAVFENASIPITVDQINGKINSHLYIANSLWDPNDINKWKDDRARGERSLQYQFDGFTHLLHVNTKVIAGQRYQIKIAIADIGDRIYDSAVFLKAGSLKSDGEKAKGVEYLQLIAENSTWDNTPTFKKVNENCFAINAKINYQTDEFRLRADMRPMLNKMVSLLKADERIQLKIIGHTDNTASSEYNKTLSAKRANVIYNYLISSGIAPNRLSFEGKGDSSPLFPNSSESNRLENRRVEFQLSLN